MQTQYSNFPTRHCQNGRVSERHNPHNYRIPTVNVDLARSGEEVILGESETMYWCDGAPVGPVARPEREGREGDSQPMPVVNDYLDIQSRVIADIQDRRKLGIKRYGTALQPHNGRDMLRDAYEEALDLAVYLKGVLVERDHPMP